MVAANRHQQPFRWAVLRQVLGGARGPHRIGRHRIMGDDHRSSTRDSDHDLARQRLRRKQRPRHTSTTDMLGRVSTQIDTERVTLGQIISWTRGRALGLLLLLLALPETIPMIGFSAVLATPIFIIGCYMLAHGDNPRLPGWLLRRSLKASLLKSVIDRSLPFVRWLDRISKPRLPLLAGSGRTHGAMCILMAVLLAAPIPGINILAAFSVAGIGGGIVQRDGLLVAFALAAGILALIATIGVVTGAFLLGEVLFG
jgi:hypothetical protein